MVGTFSHMAHVRSFSFLLVAGICLALLTVSSVRGQTGTATTTTQIKTPPPGQCTVLALPFSAPTRTELQGEISTDVPLDFYILSQSDFMAFTQAGDCEPTATANPLYQVTYLTGTYNPYSSIPTSGNGTYLFVFVYKNNGLAQPASGYGTVTLTFPSSATLLTAVASDTVTMTFSATTPEFPDQNIWLLLALTTGLAAVTLRKRK